jgi:hypothetical protein
MQPDYVQYKLLLLIKYLNNYIVPLHKPVKGDV